MDGLSRWLLLNVMGLGSLSCQMASAQQGLKPSSVFIQEGWTGKTSSTTAGALWDWRTRWSVGGTAITGYWEARSPDGGTKTVKAPMRHCWRNWA